jgi:hypothetical protein
MLIIIFDKLRYLYAILKYNGNVIFLLSIIIGQLSDRNLNVTI